jgi:hypothetical protein
MTAPSDIADYLLTGLPVELIRACYARSVSRASTARTLSSVRTGQQANCRARATPAPSYNHRFVRRSHFAESRRARRVAARLAHPTHLS